MSSAAANLALVGNQAAPLIEACDLTIRFSGGRGPIDAVHHASIALAPGEVLGVVGESGSGKSTLAQALMGYCPQGATIASGEVMFEGQPLFAAQNSRLREIWGRRIAMVHQNALSTLTPTMSVGDQIAETIRAHSQLSWKQARAEALQCLGAVNIAIPESLYHRYPHQLSGGQRQRVSIAIALCLRPRLLILDEPTTALDVTTQAVVLDLLRELRAATGTAMIYISHNLAVIGQIADRIAVMYAGSILEVGAASALLLAPSHPYTRGLVDCLPGKAADKRKDQLFAIPGELPSRRDAEGCIFRGRCARRTEVCESSPPWLDLRTGSFVRCFHPIGSEAVGGRASQPATTLNSQDDVALHIFRVSKSFPTARATLRRVAPYIAVDAADLALKKLEIIGVVGESGSGKTTLLRGMAGLTPFSSGEILLAGSGLARDISRRKRGDRKAIQMVFQDPASTLNPTLTIGENLVRHIRALTGCRRSQAGELARRHLQKVRLNSAYFDRYPRELSGGEKQRVAIARAFASGPSIVLCDEPFSALDVSVQSNIVQLLLDLQSENGASYVVVSHDLSIIRYIADRIAVMYLGSVVEEGTRPSFDTLPLHPYTEALLASIPEIDQTDRPPMRLHTQPSQGHKEGAGCVFAPRCPRVIQGVCEREQPAWHDVEGRRYRCHHEPVALARLQEAADLPRKQ